MSIDLITLKDALEATVEGAQMFAAGYMDVAIAVGSGVMLAFHALRNRIYKPKTKGTRK